MACTDIAYDATLTYAVLVCYPPTPVLHDSPVLSSCMVLLGNSPGPRHAVLLHGHAQVSIPMVLCTPYAISGTVRCFIWSYAPPTPCPVLTQRILRLLSCYAPATPSPVLSERMLLPGTSTLLPPQASSAGSISHMVLRTYY
eukprot:3856536-Rhodomonas_salina.2